MREGIDLFQIYKKAEDDSSSSTFFSSKIIAFNAALKCGNLQLAGKVVQDMGFASRRNLPLEFASYRKLGNSFREINNISIPAPLISIIIPGFNCQLSIESCINSILQMNTKSFEIIFIDDGSTDDSYKIVKSMDIPNCIVFKAFASGNSGTPRNIGLGIARGKYIGFVDSDDTVEPNYFDRMLEAIQDEKSDILQCMYFNKHVGTKSSKISYKLINSFSGKLSYCSSFVIWDKLYKYDFIKSCSSLFSSSKIGADTLFLNLLHSKQPRLQYEFNSIHYNYNAFSENSVSNQYRKNSELVMEDKPYKELCQLVKSGSMHMSDDYKLIFWLRRILSIIYCISSGDKRKNLCLILSLT